MKIEVEIPEELHKAVLNVCERFNLSMDEYVVDSVRDNLECDLDSGFTDYMGPFVSKISGILRARE